MMVKKELSLKFYQNLGKLFYAIAASDGNVRKVEFDKLKSIIKEHWLTIDDLKDPLGTDAAYQIEVVFDWLNNDEDLIAKACYDDFVTYKRKHSHLFTEDVKSLIIKTAASIAYAFSGVNKSELMMLAKLDIELKKV
jgi:hypothetical protein